MERAARMPRCWGIACAAMQPCLIVGTASKRLGRWSIRFWTCGARRRPRASRSIRRGAGVRATRMFCSNVAAVRGTTRDLLRVEGDGKSSQEGEPVILAGDVGGTKCNLALFSEKNGTLTPVFRKRFASKEFAKFDLIVKEFARLPPPHLTPHPAEPPGSAAPAPLI